MIVNFDDLENQLTLETLKRVGVWSQLSQALDRPQLSAVDFQPSDFDIEPKGEFVGLVDLLLTYHDPVSMRDDQSVTVPATVRGHIDSVGGVVVEGLDLSSERAL